MPNDTNTRAELAPCPFCRGAADTDQPNLGHYVVYCKDCGATIGDDDPGRARAAWNRRSSLATAGEPGDGDGPYAWRCTGGGLVRFMSDAKYRRQHPGVQRWYVPICSRCGRPSEASQRALLQQALEALEFSRRYPGLQQASDEELITALRAAISESEGAKDADQA